MSMITLLSWRNYKGSLVGTGFHKFLSTAWPFQPPKIVQFFHFVVSNGCPKVVVILRGLSALSVTLKFHYKVQHLTEQ